MYGLKEFVVSLFMVIMLMNSSCLRAYGAPQAAAGAAAGSSSGASTTTTTSSTTTAAGGAAGAAAGAGAGAAAAAAGAGGGNMMLVNTPMGVQGIVGGAMNLASMPINTITASLNQLGIPTIATAPLSAVSSLITQAGSVYGR